MEAVPPLSVPACARVTDVGTEPLEKGVMTSLVGDDQFEQETGTWIDRCFGEF